MDKDLFNENIKNAFDGFEADPPDFVLDKIKTTYHKQQKVSKRNNLFRGAIIASIVTILLVPVYYFTQSDNKNPNEQIANNNPKIENSNPVIVDNTPPIDNQVENNNPKTTTKKNPITVFVGDDDVTCGLSYELISTVSTGVQGTWNVIGEEKLRKVEFEDKFGLSTIVKVSEPGRYSFMYEVLHEGRTSFDDVSIEFVDLSNVSAGDDSKLCELSGQIKSNGNSGEWFSLDRAEIFSPENNKSMVKVTKAGVYSFVWKETSFSCVSFDTVKIEFVEPSGLKLSLLSEPVCSYDDVVLSAVFNTSYVSSWDFDGGIQQNYVGIKTGNEEKQIVNWSTGGKHEVILTVSNRYCIDKAVVEIIIPEKVLADYTISDPGEDVPTMVYFSNISTVGERDFNRFDNLEFVWDFGDGNASTEINPDHLYFMPGVFNPVLIANNEVGCSDTIKGRSIKLGKEISEKQPNLFTPNNDGVNDVFRINSSNLKNFKCIILTRTSEKVYEWSDATGGWDGRINGAQLASQGMYYYIIRGENFENKQVEIPGIVYLVRD